MSTRPARRSGIRSTYTPPRLGTEGGSRTRRRLPSAVFETAASAIPPLRPAGNPSGAANAARNRCGASRRRGAGTLAARHRRPAGRRQRDPMLDSPRLTIPARRAAPVVEDVRPSEAVDDPIQRRDLVLMEQARDGEPRCVQRPRRVLPGPPVRARRAHGARPRPGRPTPCRRRSSRPTGTCARSAAGSVRSWLSRIAINAAMDQQRLQEAPAVPAVPGARGRELAAARRARGRPGAHGDARRAVARPRGRPGRDHARPARTRSSCSTSRATTTPRSPSSPGSRWARSSRGSTAGGSRSVTGSRARSALFRGEDG